MKIEKDLTQTLYQLYKLLKRDFPGSTSWACNIASKEVVIVSNDGEDTDITVALPSGKIL